jgi:hypothetical protein
MVSDYCPDHVTVSKVNVWKGITAAVERSGEFVAMLWTVLQMQERVHECFESVLY